MYKSENRSPNNGMGEPDYSQSYSVRFRPHGMARFSILPGLNPIAQLFYRILARIFRLVHILLDRSLLPVVRFAPEKLVPFSILSIIGMAGSEGASGGGGGIGDLGKTVKSVGRLNGNSKTGRG